MLDSQGLVFSGRAQVDPDKARFALTPATLSHYGFETSASATSFAADYFGLDDVVRRVAPTILIGTSGVAGAFTEAAVRQMAASTPAPLVFPLSNPTANCEVANGVAFAAYDEFLFHAAQLREFQQDLFATQKPRANRLAVPMADSPNTAQAADSPPPG